MSNDGVLVVGTKVDLSALQRGMAEAQLDVRAAAADMSSAYKQLGAAARAGSQQATEALIEQQDALNAARERLTQFQRAQRSVSESTGTMTSNFYAAQGASAMLRGAIPYRALERFLADINGVNAALQMAFPIIGAIAIGEVIFESTKKLVTFTEDAAKLGRETGTNWLTGAIGQLDGLKEATKQADAELLLVARDMDRIHQQQQSEDIKRVQLTKGYAAADKMTAEQARKRIADDQAMLKTMQASRPALVEASSAQYTTINAKTGLQYTVGPTMEALDARDQLKTLDAHIKQYQDEIQELQTKAGNTDLEAAKSGAAKDAAAANKLAEQRLREFETERAQGMQNVFAEHAYWASKIDAFRKGSSEYLTVMNKVNESEKAIQREEEESLKQHRAAVARDANQSFRVMEEANKSISKFVKTSEAMTLGIGSPFDSAYMASLRAGQRALESATRSQEEFLRMKERMGLLTPQGAIAAERNAENSGYAAQYSGLAGARDVLQNRLSAQAGLDKGEPGYDPTLPSKIQQINAQIEQLDQQHAQRMQQIDLRSLQLRLGYAKQYMDAIRQDLTSSLNEWLTGTRTFGEAMHQMFDQMALQAIDSFLQIRLAAMETWALNKLFGQESAASQLATTIATNVVIAQSNAAVAATAALAQTANPAYASAIFAVGESFAAMASFDKGTSYIPRDGAAMLHKGETVLPPPQADELRQALSGRGRSSRGGDQFHLHYNGQVQTFDRTGMRSTLKAHAGDILDIVREGWKTGKLK